MNKRIGTKVLSLLLISTMLIGITPKKISASANDKITIENYIILLVKATKVKVDNNSKDSYIQTAIDVGIVSEGIRKDLKKNINREKAAVYGNRADEILNGTKFDEKLVNEIISKKRISDIKSVSKSAQLEVAKIFSKGILVGSSNGAYSQSRKFGVKDIITVSEANTIISRIKYKSKRKLISPDGQLIRTTNLPKNYKNFEYILESFPNSFYETPFRYERMEKGDGSKPTEYKDYIRPVNMRKAMFNTELGYKQSEVMNLYLDDWCKTVEKNLKCRFTVDYRTIGNSWVSDLRSTYYIWEDDAIENKKRTDSIKEYVKLVKKHKIVMKAEKVVVEQSTLHRNLGTYIRVYVKFKVVSFEGKLTQDNLFYCSVANIDGVKRGQMVEAVMDIGLGSTNGYSKGNDYSIADNSIFTLK